MNIQTRVDQAMENAIDNGYYNDEWTYKEVACDLAQHEPSLEDCYPASLEPCIRKWASTAGLDFRFRENKYRVSNE